MVVVVLAWAVQLDGNVFPGSLTHKFSLIVTLIICFVMNIFLSVSPLTQKEEKRIHTAIVTYAPAMLPPA